MFKISGQYKFDANIRKNWMFCWNAEDAAIMYSMFGCCKAHGVNYREWLIFSLNNIHKYDENYSKDLDELLPHNFKLRNQIVTVPSFKTIKVL